MRRAPHANDTPHRVVIVGGGFAGLERARVAVRALVAAASHEPLNTHTYNTPVTI
jgi:NADH dehydrogenase FAD-containing subunit